MKREKIKRSQLPPGPRVPAALKLFATWTRPAPTLETLRQRYGKRITVQLPFQPPFVILSDPEEIKQVFTAPPEVLHPGEGARVLGLIKERRAAGETDRDDVLGILLEARHDDGSPMSARELRDELMTALVAGHETTASQLAWAFERLAREPRVVERLLTDDPEYLTATVHEILRLRPVLPNAEPRLTKQPVKIGPFEYPAGVALLASAFLVHHDPGIYPEPFAFRPERFLGSAPGTYTWIPFGGGRRRCLGASFALQEMKIVIRAALARYELAPAAQKPETTGRRSITFSPRDEATVILRERAQRAVADPGALATVA